MSRPELIATALPTPDSRVTLYRMRRGEYLLDTYFEGSTQHTRFTRKDRAMRRYRRTLEAMPAVLYWDPYA